MTTVFDRQAETYSDSINESLGKFGANHDFFMEHKSWLIDYVLMNRSMDASTSRLLDVGCGTGLLHRRIGSKFARIDGIDISAASIAVAVQSQSQHHYRVYDGHRIPSDDDSYDIAIAVAVFHHVPPSKWLGLAAEMLRVTRKGGLCLVIEHNPVNPVTRHIVNNCELDEDAVLLWPAKLRALFLEAGGADVKTRAVLTIPPLVSVLRRLDHALGFAHLGAQYYMTATV
ncbi:MAG: class I SAM-dependent methyltransferase [Geminicoccaceae bacterium]